MAISREQVLHVARLARLDLRDDELERLTGELGAILDAVSKVSELDLADVPPTSHPLDLVNAWAEDEPHDSLPLEDVFRNAPAREGDLFRVPPHDMSAVVDTLRLTAEDAIGLVERGEVTPAELHRAYLEAIGERNGDLHAYLRTVDEAVGTSIPIALKDVISTRGVETTAGSRILAGYVPVFDATVAARCKAAGLTLLGKTNTDEFAMGSSTENSAYGPSRNPWDPDRVPGGSGGGTAAAVSGGLAPWGLGSDTGGSIKQPSALCGNVGLRPTYGTVSRYGVVAFASSLDQVGPVAKNVRDTALLYRIISGKDPVRLDDRRVARAGRVARVGAARRRPDRRPAAGGRARGDRARRPRRLRGGADLAEELGAEVGECDLPLSFDYGLPCYYLIAPAEASSNLARYDGVRYGPRSDGETYLEMVERTRDDGFGDEPKRRIMLGTYALSAGYYDAYYGQAQKVRTLIVREHAAAFESYDVLATPTSPTVAFPLGEKAADPLAMYACDLLTIPSCLAGLPGLNVPCGLSDGLPVGLQLIGPQFAENALFRAGHALERALGLDLVPERLRDEERRPGAREPGNRSSASRSTSSSRRGRRCSAAARWGSGRPRTRRRARSASASPGHCRFRTGLRSSGSSSSGSLSGARSRRVPSSRARTTSTPTCRRAIRSPNTIFHLALTVI